MDSFNSRDTLKVGNHQYEIFRLDALDKAGLNVSRLPFSLKILLENLLRTEDGLNVTADDIKCLAEWTAHSTPDNEIAFTPARVLLQDFTGVPVVVDLAAMRDAMAALGGDPKRINPLQPVELVIDHSVQVDAYGTEAAFLINAELEFDRNRERYAFLRWGQMAFDNFKVVPPDTGIVHQVNLEYLARVVFTKEAAGEGGIAQAYPDTLVGTDSHTTMINGLGVLGWGVGGIEAEAAMLGQPVSMLIPQVVGFRLEGALPEGATATDLVLTATQMLRQKGVVGKFVEFYGPGLPALTIADRATLSNMAPEYGATCGIFPVDDETLRYLRFSGRSEEQIALVEAYCKAQGLFHTAYTPEAEYSDSLTLDLSTVLPSVAGPRRPQDRVLLSEAKDSFESAVQTIINPGGVKQHRAAEQTARFVGEGGGQTATLPEQGEVAMPTAVKVALEDNEYELDHGSIVIAAITSCTNTSNPSVMVGAGLLAKKAVERGLATKPWVKTSMAPGSKVVTAYLDRADLTRYFNELRFNTVGYGCTTCIGNSGPLPSEISTAVDQGNLVVVSVLSGNRNFEARINSEVKANYLMSPPLVVAYALAGRMDIDLLTEPLGSDKTGQPVYLRDLWPTQEEVSKTIGQALQADMFRKSYDDVFAGDERWNSLDVAASELFQWEPESTYVRQPPYFDSMTHEAATYVRHPPYFDGMSSQAPTSIADINGARLLALLGDSVTTDHISPAGSIKKNSPAGQYLIEHGVEPKDFNSYGARRGNHEVMMRGTFANVQLRNKLAPGTQGGVTTYLPTGEQMSIYDASALYQQAGTPLIVIGGKEYGTGSSRDWAAKGPMLLGIKAVIAESIERIHRSNLIGMGILPLQFNAEENAAELGLTGDETFDIIGLQEAIMPTDGEFKAGQKITVRATRPDGVTHEFSTTLRIDTPQEALYYQHGGILQYVLRQLLAQH